MSPDFMKPDPHERARLLIALSAPEAVKNEESSPADQRWLETHLATCEPCNQFAQNSRSAIRALRATPMQAGVSLVSATQMRVRQRAAQLHRQQERFWIICACCAAVSLCTAVSTAVLWFGFAWLGQQARLAAPVWQSGFAVFWLMPSLLVAILLLAWGTHFADHKN